MEKVEFDDYFKALDKASDRLRRVIYAYIIVSVAMLLYALSAFAYPAQQIAYDHLSQKASCFFSNFSDANCKDAKEDFEDHKVAPSMKDDVNKVLWEHQLLNLYDDSVKNRSFSFPIFGLQTDRDLLWILFPLVGIIGYYIILLTLGSMIRLFVFLRDENLNDPFRLRLIQSTLVITTPLEASGGNAGRRHGELGPFFRSLWRVLALVVCFIPIFISMLIVADQTNAIAHYIRQLQAEKFFDKPSTLFEVQLWVEAGLAIVEVVLFLALVQLGRLFGDFQKQLEAQIQSVEDQKDDRMDQSSTRALAAD